LPAYPDVLNNLAGLLAREALKRTEPRRSDMLDEAEGLARKATRLDPDRPEPHDTLGEILLRAGKAAEALAPFGKALDLARAGGEPTAWMMPHVLLHRAEAELGLERRADARRTLAEALSLDPDLREDPSVKNLEYRLR
jgi:tetratricopeptide (TPR) repeat protein